MLPSTSEALRLDAAAVADVILRALRHEVSRVGFGKAILGLSGGLDSALVANLAVRAFGPENVILVCMPATTSNPSSLGDARVVADALGVKPLLIPIGPQIDLYFADKAEASAIRRGNKMARERMTILYDLSASEGALVLGTSNKTELLLGYSTLFGDSACAIMPIGDLYKTQVFALAQALSVPDVALQKAPSADLWEGQTDEGELGFTYAAVDALLVEMVDRRQRRAELLTMGFEAEFVDRIAQRMRGQQFKRKLPVIVKLSSRTIDKDFLYPRDWTG